MPEPVWTDTDCPSCGAYMGLINGATVQCAVCDTDIVIQCVVVTRQIFELARMGMESPDEQR